MAPPDRGVHRGADPEVALHALAAQVEVAVAEPDHLVDAVGPLVDRERRRQRGRQHLDGAVADLDRTGGQRVVGGALGPGAHRAGDADDELAAQVVGAVDHALHDAGVVAQVDEREVLAVLAAPSRPSRTARPTGPRARRAARRTCGCASTRSRVQHLPDVIDHGLEVDGRTARPPSDRGSSPCPPAFSSSPTMTATRAPLLLAAFIWDFMLRPSKARSVATPASRSDQAERRGDLAAGGVDDEAVDPSTRARRTRPRRRS